jgi:hypothetical protein
VRRSGVDKMRRKGIEDMRSLEDKKLKKWGVEQMRCGRMYEIEYDQYSNPPQRK